MILLDNLNKRFHNKVILENVNFQLPLQKRIGLVGPNGAGKTTLLNILCNLEEADSGKVQLAASYRVGYLPQVPNVDPMPTILDEAQCGAKHLSFLKAELEDIIEKMAFDHSDELLSRHDQIESEFRRLDGYALESKAKAILFGLGFSTEIFSKNPKELSGGWRMRLELVKIFIDEPDFLILDEPTNHLDLPSLVWVENYLRDFKGTLLFVSHDRNLLNRLSNHTLLLKNGTIESYPFSFEKALEKREEKLNQEAAVKQGLSKKRKQMEDFVERFGAKASKAKQAQSRVKMIAKLKDLEDSIEDDEVLSSVSFRLPEPLKSGIEILKVDDVAIGYSKALATGINLKIERGQKIAIIGANGIGKSTFLKTVVGNIPKLNGQIEFGHNVRPVYFSQDHEDTLDFNLSCLDNILAANHDIGELEARSLLGSFLFKGEDVKKPVDVLSGGEKSRVALAKILVQRGNFLILDEPTNHLDMSSVEALINNISNYAGTLLFVSHDRNFIDSVATHILVMLADGRSMLFEGNLEDYQRLSVISGFPDVLDPQYLTLKSDPEPESKSVATSESKLSHQEAKENKRKIQNLERKITKHEELQASLKAKRTKCEALLLETEPSNYQKLNDIKTDMEKIDSELESSEEEWLALVEDLELLVNS